MPETGRHSEDLIGAEADRLAAALREAALRPGSFVMGDAAAIAIDGEFDLLEVIRRLRASSSHPEF